MVANKAEVTVGRVRRGILLHVVAIMIPCGLVMIREDMQGPLATVSPPPETVGSDIYPDR